MEYILSTLNMARLVLLEAEVRVRAILAGVEPKQSPSLRRFAEEQVITELIGRHGRTKLSSNGGKRRSSFTGRAQR
jgi:hypothetical protein